MATIDYGNTAYWQAKYEEEMGTMLKFELFDWYASFADILDQVESIFGTSNVHKVLIVGIGRSNAIEVLYKKGFRNIVAIDISNTIIVEMRKKYATYAGVEFFVMDVKQLSSFSDETFSMVFDKACIDSLFCSADFIDTVTLALHEIHRVMKFDGVFVSVSHASKLARVPYFRLVHWAIDHYKVSPEAGEGLSLFTMTKTTNEELLNKKIPGAEAVIMPKAVKVVSTLEQNMNKSSTTRKTGNTGSITVTASVDVLADLVADVAGKDE